MRQAIVAGNWKMHGTKSSVAALLSEITQNRAKNAAELCIIFPPYVYFDQIQQLLEGSNIAYGAQNLSANEPGAYTGEISAQMVKEFACSHVLVGHSERRHLFNEDNTLVAMKFAQAKQHDLIPVLCVGETQKEREAGQTDEVIQQQLQAILQLSDGIHMFQNAVIAYEPVWAIGTGLTATPDQAQAVHAMIRAFLAAADKNIAEKLSILYGGSVRANNARELFTMPDIDGGLVGGASLDANEFLEILSCIN